MKLFVNPICVDILMLNMRTYAPHIVHYTQSVNISGDPQRLTVQLLANDAINPIDTAICLPV